MASVQGFLDGYQTMDTLAALNFGIIVTMNIQARGIKKEKSVMNETIWAGWIAGIVLLIVYAMLTFVGMNSRKNFPETANGTEVLMKMSEFLFGRTGMIILAASFLIGIRLSMLRSFLWNQQYSSSFGTAEASLPWNF